MPSDAESPASSEPGAKRSLIPPWLSLGLRLLCSGILVWFLVSRLDTANMARFLRQAHLPLVALTLMTVLMDRAFMVSRWILLLEALGFATSRGRVIRIFFLSTFFGSFLPSGIGGEAVRAISFSRLTSRSAESVASVIMDRFLGLLSMLLTGLLALGSFYQLSPDPALLVAVVVLLGLAILGLGMLLSVRWNERIVRLISSIASRRVSWLNRLVGALGRYRHQSRALIVVLGLSVGVQLLRVTQAYLLSEAMSLGVRFEYFLCFIPIILVVTMLPISVGGWGTTNAAYWALFVPVGMDPDGAFVLSVLILALGVFGNLPGGLIYAWEGFDASDASR